MNDYAKRTDINLDRSKELFNVIRQELMSLINTNRAVSDEAFNTIKDCINMIDIEDKNFISRIEGKIREIKTDWDDSLVPVDFIDMLDEIHKFNINTYTVSDTFSILNDIGYKLIRDAIVTIGGEASAGKTSFVSCISLDILQHNSDTGLLFYSLDDSIPFSGKRMSSQLLYQSLEKEIDTSNLSSEHINIGRRIFIKDKFNIHTLEKEAMQIKRMRNCKRIVIAIDYLQIISNTTDLFKRDFLNEMVKELKEIQKRLTADGGCLLFLLSQLSRDATNKYRYRETSEIENQSDVCIDIENNNIDDENPERHVIVKKNKSGSKGRKLQTSITPYFNFTQLINTKVDTKIEKGIKTNTGKEKKNYYTTDDIKLGD